MRFALATVLVLALSLVSASPSALRRDETCSSAGQPCSSTPAVIGGTADGVLIQDCCDSLQCVDEEETPAQIFGEPVIAIVGVRLSSSLCVEMHD